MNRLLLLPRLSAATVTNSLVSAGESLASPALAFLATPFLVNHLGKDQYGIWLLALALSGTIGFVNVGLGDSVIRYVAFYRGANDSPGAARIVRNSLGLSLVAAAIVIAIGVAGAPILVDRVFHAPAASVSIEVGAIRLGAILLALRSIEGIYLAALRGGERFRTSAAVSVPVRLASMLLSVGLVAAGFGIQAMLIGASIVTAIGLLFESRAVRNMLASSALTPALNRSTLKEIFSFWAYGWLAGLGALLTNQADRLVLAAMTGPALLAAYAICLQPAQQIQALIAPAVSIVFPRLSAQTAAGGSHDQRRVLRITTLANMGASALLCAPLLFFAHLFLRLWMGAAFADSYASILRLLAAAFFFLSLNTGSYFFLLAVGKIRYTTAVSVASSAIALLISIPLIRSRGIEGAALGRIAYAVLSGLLMTGQTIAILARKR